MKNFFYFVIRNSLLVNRCFLKAMTNNNMNETIGAVMVVGGGIAGIQASMDMADHGFYVYLVEKSSAIGGLMAGLDKTFPTNDCSI